MTYKVKDVPAGRVSREECHHYWIIESASGPTSRGVCKFCGAEKEFFNAVPDLVAVKKDTHLLGLPKLPDVELDRENNS